MVRHADSKTHYYSSSFYLLLLAVISFSFSNADSQKYLSRRIEVNPENIYVSLRSAFALLQNNKHDFQSNLFIEEQVKSKLSSDKKDNKNQLDLSISQLSLNEKIESIDLSAISDEYKYVYTNFLGSSNATMIPLGIDTFNAVNYYLPDSYNTFISGFPKDINYRNSYLFGLGKNFDVNSISHYGGFGLYPSISSFPYLILLSGEKDQPTLFTFDIPNYLREPFLQKLSNIVGIDYIVYIQSLFPDSYSDFLDHGFIPIYSDKQFGIVIFQNPNSYGKAYLANRVDYIDPVLYYANIMPADEKMNWPYSAVLLSSFKGIISKIPDDKYSVIIETDQKNNISDPEIVSKNNSLSISKILASKAMFDVNCQSASCWFVYNSSFLKGWKAFVGSNPVEIFRTNLGFIGIQIPSGNHTVWLEYRPDSLILGECITLIGWFFITSLLVAKTWRRKSE